LKCTLVDTEASVCQFLNGVFDVDMGDLIMNDAILDSVAVPSPIPVRELLPWIIFGGLLLLLAIYFVGAEEGATSLIPGMYVHEFVHDGRHLLGFPCH
jgi:Probable cobalt transporter subunit (CbtB)